MTTDPATLHKLVAAVQVLAIDYRLNDSLPSKDMGGGARAVPLLYIKNPTTTAQCRLCGKKATAGTPDEARYAIGHVPGCVAAQT